MATKYKSLGARGTAHGGYAAVVAVGQFLQRSALRPPSGRLFPLGRCVREGGMLSLGLGAAPVFGGARADLAGTAS